MKKDWSKASDRIHAAIARVVTPSLQREVNKALAKFPKATRISIQDGMGRVWIQVEDVDGNTMHLHCDDDDLSMFDVHGYKGNRHTSSRTMRIPRLASLAAAMFECADFLDEFRACFPEIEAVRK